MFFWPMIWIFGSSCFNPHVSAWFPPIAIELLSEIVIPNHQLLYQWHHVPPIPGRVLQLPVIHKLLPGRKPIKIPSAESVLRVNGVILASHIEILTIPGLSPLMSLVNQMRRSSLCIQDIQAWKSWTHPWICFEGMVAGTHRFVHVLHVFPPNMTGREIFRQVQIPTMMDPKKQTSSTRGSWYSAASQ